MILLDTSGLFSILDRRDPHHRDALTFFEAAPACLTHSYVLAELVPLCLSRKVARPLAIEFSKQVLAARNISVVWVDSLLHDGALAMLEARPDKEYPLCDAASFVLMEERGLMDALTTDHHFEQAGFRRLLGWGGT